MWPFSKKTPDPNYSNLEVLEDIIDQYLQLLSSDDEWDTEQQLDVLTSQGYPLNDCWAIIGLAPIIAGRVALRDLGASFSNRISLISGQRVIKTAEMVDFLPWQALKNKLDKITAHEKAAELAQCSAEFNAINQLMLNGPDPSDLALTDVGLMVL